MNWTCEENSKYVKLLHNGTVILRLDKGGLTVLQFQKEVKAKKSKKKSKRKSLGVSKEDIMMFSRAYQSSKSKYYNNKSLLKKSCLEGKNPDMFAKALLLARQHKVQPKVLIEAQIFGFKDMNNGKGHFPYPAQLSTDSAEIRLMEYLRKGKTATPKVKITYEEKQTPLTQNAKYLTFLSKVKEKTATLEQALYCQELQLARRGEISKTISTYIEKVVGS